MKKQKLLVILFFLLGFILILTTNVNAKVSANNKTVTSGQKVSITVTSSTGLESFDLQCIDTGGLTYKSCSSSVTSAVVNSSGKKISYAAVGGNAKTLGTYTFVAPKVTEEKKYTVKFDVDGTSVSSTVTVKPESTNNTGTTGNNNGSDKGNNSSTTTKKSTNANLKTLGVRISESLAKELGVKTNAYDFTGFSKNKTSYSVTVPSTVDSLKVSYETEDSKASVKVSGNSGFEVGSNNEIKVVVTAEDGKTTTYTIKVTKLAEDTEKPGNVIDDDNNEGLYLTSLTIKGIKLSPIFAKDTYSYTATLSDASVNELEIEAKANNEKANIAISGNTDLVEGENTINLILTLDDSPEQTIYQVVVNKEAVALPAATTTSLDSNQSSNNNDFMGSIKTYLWIVIAVIVLVVVVVIVLIILLRRENKRLQDEDIDDEEYNVYKNDANEFQNKNENFIESLYKQRDEKAHAEELNEIDKETLEEINKQTDEIFKDKVQGQSVEYGTNELENEKSLGDKKKKGRHF